MSRSVAALALVALTLPAVGHAQPATNLPLAHQPATIEVAEAETATKIPMRIAVQDDVVGAWERIPFQQDTVNSFEPWPLPHQYFAIQGNGRISWMMASQKAEGLTAHDLVETLNQLRWNSYEFKQGFALVSYPDAPDKQEVWLFRVVEEEAVLGGVELKAGDLLMTLVLQNKEGQLQAVYFRLLRRLPD